MIYIIYTHIYSYVNKSQSVQIKRYLDLATDRFIGRLALFLFRIKENYENNNFSLTNLF